MKQHTTYHPLGEELMKQYTVFVLNEDGPLHAAAHCDHVGLDALHRERFLGFLPHFAQPSTEPFDQTHGYSMALTQGFFETYYYVHSGSLSALGQVLSPYTATWQSVLPDWPATASAQNHISTPFCSGVYIPAGKIAPLMNDAHAVPALAEALAIEFVGTKLDVLWAALLRANELGVGLLEATGAIRPNAGDLMATECFTDFANCDPVSLQHYLEHVAALAPPPPRAPDAVTEADWHLVVAVAAAPFGIESMFAATFNDARANAGQLAALTGSTKALATGLWFDAADGSILEQTCRELVDHRIGWSDDDFGRMSDLQFSWQGADTEVEQGLEAFDRWLQDRGTDWRLVSVQTGADYFLSILSPFEKTRELIHALAAAGVTSSLQDGSQPDLPSAPAPPPPPPPPTGTPPPPPPSAAVPPPPWESPARTDPLPWEVAAANVHQPGTRLPGQAGLAERLRARREAEQ